ncbi:hypothetical protein BDU57DRAFT_525351 [Ampelomyces quisqualis]|uniref:Uncharacterized protein n=1 Tax=Ampelomyces quisqualis TaxID=50730 RepID=A0A6A5R069_AMPQU|nr:hypothetical protein BDU57DRAFT_525351 [Ampelomyces quisqualis]
MRSSTYIALFAGSAAAQSSAAVFNMYPFDMETLTQIGADATATTYKFDCPATSAGISVIPSAYRPSPDATITPAPAPRGRLARQAVTSSMTSDSEDYGLCEPFTIKQGPSTYEYHLTDPLPGAWTVDINCKFQGAITAADLDCTASMEGYVPPASLRGKSTSLLPKDEIETMGFIQQYAIVTSSGAGSASATPTGSQSGSAKPSGSGSGAAAASPSTGFAPVGPLPSGVMALVGGAAGVFAALAL